MKKRRELDALVGNGKMNRGRNSKKSQELLLENMSDSSDIEEFTLQGPTGKTVVRKRGFMHFCKSCLTVCSFFMLLSCVVAVVGLILVYNDLKGEIEREQKLYATLSRSIEDMSPLSTNIETINKSVTDVTTELSELKAKIEKNDDDSPDLINLKNTVEELTKTVAQMGSNIETLKSGVEDAQKAKPSPKQIKAAIEQLKNRTSTLENRLDLLELKSSGHATTVATIDMHELVQQAVASVTEDLKNYTVAGVESKLQVIDDRISSLENKAFQPTSPAVTPEGYLSAKDFMTSTSNQFVFLNSSIQSITDNIVSIQDSVNAQEERIVPLEQISTQYKETQDNLVKKIEEIDNNINSAQENNKNRKNDNTPSSVEKIVKENGDSDNVNHKQVSVSKENDEMDGTTGKLLATPLGLLTTTSTTIGIKDNDKLTVVSPSSRTIEDDQPQSSEQQQEQEKFDQNSGDKIPNGDKIVHGDKIPNGDKIVHEDKIVNQSKGEDDIQQTFTSVKPEEPDDNLLDHIDEGNAESDRNT